MLQSQDDLTKHLMEQLEFLKRSAKSYDEGFEGEAKRMATVIRLLVHETKRSRSLLGQLQLISIDFYDTAADLYPENLFTHHGLAIIHFEGDRVWYQAPLDDLPPPFLTWTTFDQWWDKIVFVDNQKRTMSRKHLVLSVADKDGGAHVDPKLDETYAAISRSNSMGWVTGNDYKEPGPLDGRVELASVRQIAHEVISTLARAGISS